MRIAIDCRKLSENKTGIANYIENILKELIKVDAQNEYLLLSDQKIVTSLPNSNVNNVKFIVLDDYKTLFKRDKLYKPFWLNILVPRFLKKNKVDLFWGPNFLKPVFFSSKKSIVTIHDMAYIHAKGDHPKLHGIYSKFLLSLTVNKHLKILTVSESSKKDILNSFNIPPQNVFVTYCALENNKYSEIYNPSLEDVSRLESKYKLPDKFMLFVGTTEKRKNLSLIIKSINYSIQEGLPTLPLVIVGNAGNSNNSINKLIKEYKIEDKIIFTGYISDEDLKALYYRANIFVFPSLYEGFGIPVLEAMALRTPVITSNTSSLPEVVGDAALQINPNSTEELSLAISELLTEENKYNELVVKGLERIKIFSWKDSANVVKEVINK